MQSISSSRASAAAAAYPSSQGEGEPTVSPYREVLNGLPKGGDYYGFLSNVVNLHDAFLACDQDLNRFKKSSSTMVDSMVMKIPSDWKSAMEGITLDNPVERMMTVFYRISLMVDSVGQQQSTLTDAEVLGKMFVMSIEAGIKAQDLNTGLSRPRRRVVMSPVVLAAESKDTPLAVRGSAVSESAGHTRITISEMKKLVLEYLRDVYLKGEKPALTLRMILEWLHENGHIKEGESKFISKEKANPYINLCTKLRRILLGKSHLGSLFTPSSENVRGKEAKYTVSVQEWDAVCRAFYGLACSAIKSDNARGDAAKFKGWTADGVRGAGDRAVVEKDVVPASASVVKRKRVELPPLTDEMKAANSQKPVPIKITPKDEEVHGSNAVRAAKRARTDLGLASVFTSQAEYKGEIARREKLFQEMGPAYEAFHKGQYPAPVLNLSPDDSDYDLGGAPRAPHSSDEDLG